MCSFTHIPLGFEWCVNFLCQFIFISIKEVYQLNKALVESVNVESHVSWHLRGQGCSLQGFLVIYYITSIIISSAPWLAIIMSELPLTHWLHHSTIVADWRYCSRFSWFIEVRAASKASVYRTVTTRPGRERAPPLPQDDCLILVVLIHSFGSAVASSCESCRRKQDIDYITTPIESVLQIPAS